jgi:hypothetical protein
MSTTTQFAHTISRLRELGAVQYDLWLPETKELDDVLHPGEEVLGIVYGRYKQQQLGRGVLIGRGALVATSQRIMLIDKKPMFVRCDEISAVVVSAVTYSKVGPAGTVTLHTRLGDIAVRTFNDVCAHNFVEAIESIIFKSQGGSHETSI